MNQASAAPQVVFRNQARKEEWLAWAYLLTDRLYRLTVTVSGLPSTKLTPASANATVALFGPSSRG